MNISKHQAKVLSIKCQSKGIYTLQFSSSKRFKYIPGQFLHLALDEYDPSNPWPESRCFSIQSSPGDENIKITYALKGEFTKRMEKELYVGKNVWLKLPYGELFIQSHNKTNTAFIAGGTGITPFLSLFTDNSFSEYENPKLYIGFKSEEHFFYQDELDKASKINPNLQIVCFFEDINGIINIEEIYNNHELSSDYFISGPPTMIKLFKDFLLSKSIPLEMIKTDNWE